MKWEEELEQPIVGYKMASSASSSSSSSSVTPPTKVGPSPVPGNCNFTASDGSLVPINPSAFSRLNLTKMRAPPASRPPIAPLLQLNVKCNQRQLALDKEKKGGELVDDTAVDHMIQNGLQPKASTLTALVNGYCKQGKLKKALQVIQLMKTKFGCKPTIQTYNCLLKGLCYVGRVEDAFQLLGRIKEASWGVEPDVYTYTAVMDGYCKVGRCDEAMELLEDAIGRGLTPNVVTFNTLLDGYNKEGRPLEGLGVLKRMRASACNPDFISYATLLHGLLLWGEARAALGVYKEMVGAGFDVDERLMRSLLRRLCRASYSETDLLEDAYQVFGDIRRRGFVVDRGDGSLMVGALCAGDRADDALLALQQMVASGFIPRLVTWNCVIRALCFGGQVGEAFLLLLLLYEVGRMPSRTSYDLLIRELNRQGKTLGACNVFAAALVRGVVPCRKPRRHT